MLRAFPVVLALVLMLLTACGDYKREVITLPTNYSVNQNHLFNGGFEIWQRGVGTDVLSGETRYQADRWYVTNDIGTESKIRYSQEPALSPDQPYAAAVEVTKAPEGNENGGVALYQTLESTDSRPFIGKTASFSVLIRAKGKVNEVAIQLMTNSTEAPVTTPLGPEERVTVYGDRLVSARLQGVPIGDALTKKGVIGVRIQVVGVSEGNRFDRGNGFSVEQAMLNVGPLSADFTRRSANFGEELLSCQRYFEKSYNQNGRPGAEADQSNGVEVVRLPVGGDTWIPVRYAARKRISTPIVTLFDHKDGTPNRARSREGDKFFKAHVEVLGEGSFGALFDSVPNNEIFYFHWMSDADMYPAKP